MLQLRVHGGAELVDRVAERLRALPGARHLTVAPGIDDGQVVLLADLHNDAADPAVAIVRGLGVEVQDIVLMRVEDVGPASALARPESVVWTDLVAQAGLNARPAARYLTLMGCAGVVASFAVMDDNVTLIVGAMAISPDMLPLIAACIGVVAGRPPLAARGLLVLILGLGFAGLVAGLVTAGLDLAGLSPPGFPANLTTVAGQGKVTSETILVALAAGVAGMLAQETRASAAVGVAISVTTIPAAAYIGVALGAGITTHVASAFAVLFTNLLMILLAGTTTLWLQQKVRRR